MGIVVDVQDFSADIADYIEEDAITALEECGLTAEGYAKRLCPVDTGNLRNSITHTVVKNEKAAYVGSNNSYASYVELGTGKYYPGGRRGWWVYVTGSSSNNTPSGNMKTYTYEQARRVVAMLRAKGLDAHMTEGQPAKPYIKPSVSEHIDEYRDIITSYLGRRYE